MSLRVVSGRVVGDRSPGRTDRVPADRDGTTGRRQGAEGADGAGSADGAGGADGVGRVDRATAADAAPAGPVAPLAASVLVGNPKAASRTLGVACRVAGYLCDDLRATGLPLADPEAVDLSSLARELADWDAVGPPVEHARQAVCGARLLVVASPTFKAAYSGLLKVFLDGLPRRALDGVVAVPVMTAASPAHAFAVDTCLRPVLVELGATVPVPGLTVLESEFDSLPAAVDRWRASSAPVLAAVLSA